MFTSYNKQAIHFDRKIISMFSNHFHVKQITNLMLIKGHDRIPQRILIDGIIVRIEFSPLGLIYVSNGHYYTLEKTDKDLLVVTSDI